MAIVHLIQATDMSTLPTALNFSYEPANASLPTLLATANMGTPYTGDDWRLGHYGSFTEIPGLIVGTAFALTLDTGADPDDFPNLFVDDTNVGVNTFTGLHSDGNILAIFQSALAGNDTVTGSNGNDFILSFGGNDLVDARKGADTVSAGPGNDRVFGGAANDVIFGGDGIDAMFGGSGSDDLRGGRGNDVYVGGTGHDFLRADADADRFVFDSVADSPVGKTTRDIIFSFNRSQGDRIDLRAIDANARASAPGNQAFEFIGTAAFTGNAGDPQNRGEIRIVDTGSDIRVFGDINGNRAPDFEILVRGIAVLGVVDFFL